MIKCILMALTGLLLAVSVTADAQVVPFPQSLPANTVVGRLGISAGPAQAVPFSVLTTNLFSSLCSTDGAIPVFKGTTASWVCSTTVGWSMEATPGTNTYTPSSGSVANTVVSRVGTNCNTTGIFTTPGIGPAPSSGHMFVCGDYADSTSGNISNIFSVAYNSGTRFTAATSGIGVLKTGTTGGNAWGGQFSAIAQGNGGGILQGANIEADWSTGTVTGIALTLKLGDSAGGATVNAGNSYINMLADAGKTPVTGLRFQSNAFNSTNTQNVLNLEGGSAVNGINLSSATITGNAFASTGFNVTGAGAIATTNSTASSSTSTGALTVTGGVGIGGQLNAARGIATTQGLLTAVTGGVGFDAGGSAMRLYTDALPYKFFTTNNFATQQFEIPHTASATRWITVTGSNGGNPVMTTTAGALAINPNNGHIPLGGGSAPTLTAGCNGAGSVVSGTDAAGTITGQTAAATTCTLQFGTAYSATPNCVASGQTSPLTGAFTPSTTTLVVNFASTANYKWSYVCHGS